VEGIAGRDAAIAAECQIVFAGKRSEVAGEFGEGARRKSGLFLATKYGKIARSNMNCFLQGGLSRRPLFSRPFLMAFRAFDF
jgi:hypothetical protein